MTTTNFKSLDDFARNGARQAALAGRAIAQSGSAEVAKRAAAYAGPLTPIGGVLTKDRHPGLMKRSWVQSSSTPGITALGNTAPYAGIIDRGRKRGVTPIGAKQRLRSRGKKKLKPNKQARMLGSKQAPAGITRPLWRRLKKERAAIEAAAARELEKGG